MMKTLFFNGNILTMNDDQPHVEALLIENENIIAVGDLATIKTLLDETTQLIDLKGKTLVPGFIDGHGHAPLSALYPQFAAPPIGTVDSLEKLIAAATAYLKQHPVHGESWFLGMGYDNAAFPDKKHPTKKDLDRISTEIPIVMMHVSGHVGCVNSKALAIANITSATPNPEGGLIHKDPTTGEPTGFMEEKAIIKMMYEQLARMTDEELLEGALRSQTLHFQNGVTTAQDGCFDETTHRVLKLLQENNLLKIDYYVYPLVDSTHRSLLVGRRSKEQLYDHHLKIAGAKVYLDGSPQAKTAWLTEPYHIPPETERSDYCGYPSYESNDKVCALFKDCLENGWQVLVHCNGDAALDQFITQYERAQQETGITEDLRPVVIHCQVVREDQLDRMKEIGLRPSFFNDHVLFWGDWHLDSVLGPKRGRRISPLASAVKRGMPFTLHQDCPVALPNMILSLHNAVNRKTASGRDIGAEYAVTPLEALRAITIYGAYQCFEETTKGSLETGKRADLVVLDNDPLTMPKEEIKNIRVLATYKDGLLVHQSN